MPKDYSYLLNKSSVASKNYFDVILTLIQYKEQIKICHWQTTSFSQHKAFDTLYEELNDTLDTLVEVTQGKYNRFVIDGANSVKLDNIGSLDIVSLNNAMTDYLVNVLPTYFDPKDTEVMNIRDELLSSINQVKYLLTLS